MRLVELLTNLRLGPRTGPDAVRDLLRILATDAIQDDPANATVPAPNTIPPEVLEALEYGAAEAARLAADGLRLRVDVKWLPLPAPSGRLFDRPTMRIGPFLDWDEATASVHLLRVARRASPERARRATNASKG
jgi:hypothetical protein